MVEQAQVLRVAIPVALVGSLLAVRYLDRPGGSWGRRLRSRLLLGVPWGTLVSVAFVLAVYLLVQGGLDGRYGVVTLPFHSWSYLYPLGWLTAAFAHSGFGHLTGNLLGALVLGTLAEYAWGHFPTRRGSHAFGSPLANPYVRAFVAFPLGVLAVGLATALLSWGPIIGFSGVVYAFAGFALVRYPVGAVVGLTAEEVVTVVYNSLRDPVVFGEASQSFSRPWWYGVAVQGHLLGLLLGVVVGVAVLRHREERPSALRLWVGAVLVATAMTVWAVWWYRGGDSYVLYRGLGVLLVAVLALVVTAAVTASDRSLVPDAASLPATGRPRLGILPSLGSPSGDLTRRQAASLLLAVPLLTMAFVAVPVNLSTVEAGSVPGDTHVEAGDYTVTYAEDVPNRKVSVIDVSVLGETTQVNTSGVIVVSPERHLWTREISPAALAFDGQRGVRVGGVGWERVVDARRRGWSAAGGGTAYHVWLRPRGAEWRHAFASGPATAEPVLAGRNVSVVPANETFYLRVTDGNVTAGFAQLPAENGTAEAGGLRFDRRDGRVVASVNETRVVVASAESYE